MLLLLIALGCADLPCGPDHMCQVDGGRYLAYAPSNAQGPLPVVTVFHGYGGSARKYADDDLIDAAAEAGVLLVLPDGLDNSWNVQPDSDFGSADRDEVAYMDRVLADAGERWNIDRDQTVTAGFSVGASMAVLLGCERADDWTALYAMSGTFWEPQPTTCDGPGRSIRQVWGTQDTTWPRTGRSFGGHAKQGDIDESLDMWRAHLGCDLDAVERVVDGPLTCDRWASCENGATVEDCRHNGGHRRPSGWFNQIVGWWEPS
jgi:polyhydroxybutyrate depolymerase